MNTLVSERKLRDSLKQYVIQVRYNVCYRANQLSTIQALDMTAYLEKETEYVPWVTALGSIAFIGSMLKGRPGYKSYEVRPDFHQEYITWSTVYLDKIPHVSLFIDIFKHIFGGFQEDLHSRNLHLGGNLCQLNPFFDDRLSDHLCDYQKGYSTQLLY